VDKQKGQGKKQMSKKDTVTKAFMRENTVFADAFNYLIFNGKKVIQPERLQELDTTELVQLIAKGKNNKNESVQKYRDILKAAVIMEDENADYLLLGIENQTEHEMMDFPLEEMRTFIQDYKIHLIDPTALEPDELEKFSTSLREVLGCIKYSKDKEKLSSFIRNNTRMMLEINAARVIQAITNITLDLSEEVEEVDMCKAIDDMMQDSREEGKAEGRTEGILFALTGLVRDGVLSIKDAAFRANMTESAFEAAMKKI
jgi:hypothetical protein